MPTSFQDSLSHLTGRMVDLLWCQWSSIGVAGHARALVRAGVSHELRSSRDQRGADLIQSLLADIDSLLGY